MGVECEKTKQQPDTREAKQFLSKMWERRDHTRKAEWINNMEKELQELKERPKAKIYLHLLRAALKKYQIGKLQAMMIYKDYGLWFKEYTSIHDRLALKMNRCFEERLIPEWTAKEKTTLIQKDLPPQWNCPKEL